MNLWCRRMSQVMTHGLMALRVPNEFTKHRNRHRGEASLYMVFLYIYTYRKPNKLYPIRHLIHSFIPFVAAFNMTALQFNHKIDEKHFRSVDFIVNTILIRIFCVFEMLKQKVFRFSSSLMKNKQPELQFVCSS